MHAKGISNFEWIDIALLPPLPLFACGVDIVVVDGAERNGELITHLQAKPSRLGVAHVMSVRGNSSADQTRLACHKA